MDAVAAARQFFPLMPDEVFSSWIAELVDFNGWPFDADDDSFPSDQWSRFFVHVPLAKWADAVWTRRTFKQSAIRLAPQSTQTVVDVGTNSFHATRNFIALEVANSATRVMNHLAFIRRERRFPGFLTAWDDPGGMLLVDGHHRLAALWLADTEGIVVPVWVAGGK